VTSHKWLASVEQLPANASCHCQPVARHCHQKNSAAAPAACTVAQGHRQCAANHAQGFPHRQKMTWRWCGGRRPPTLFVRMSVRQRPPQWQCYYPAPCARQRVLVLRRRRRTSEGARHDGACLELHARGYAQRHEEVRATHRPPIPPSVTDLDTSCCPAMAASCAWSHARGQQELLSG